MFCLSWPRRQQTRKQKLRLDIESAALAPLKETKGAYAIVKGKPELSEIYRRITSDDPDYQMPTPAAHVGLLNDHEIGLIRKWIEQGAHYEKHWAFSPPQKAKIPEPAGKRMVQKSIDNFVFDKMKSAGLESNEEADKERLLKRASFDITGLPPSTELMDAF